EMDGFVTIVRRMKLYRDMSAEQYNRVIDRAVGIIDRNDSEKALAQFARVLPEGLHKAVFANACDLVLADGIVEAEEKEFINKLRKALNLNTEEAQMIAKVMVYKNQG